MTLRNGAPRNVIRTLLALAALIAYGVAAADPPARVARMANIDGAVSFSPAGEEDWVIATPNRPLITGDRVWVDADARAELQIGTLAVRLANQSSVVILNLDDRVAQFQLQQGVLNIRVRSMAPDETIEVDTPLLAFSLRRPGVYRVDVDAATGATGVAIDSGEGDAYGETVAYTIGERQWYRFSDAALRDYQYDALPPADAFDEWTRALDRSEDNAVAARYVSPEVIGYSDLDRYGAWTAVEGYGNVWVPTAVASDWAPYSDGRWAWIEPWGWTWVDAAPWGFAPFHYGRWAYARERWCWVPGPRRERAVYAPALVAFVGGGNLSMSVGAGGPARGIAWFPLAPGEVYRPGYHVSRNYFTRVNASNTNVTNVTITNVYNSPDAPNVIYRNRNQRGAVTAMAATQFAQSRPVARSSATLAREVASTAPVTSVASIAPVRASVLGGSAAAGAPGSAAAAPTRPPSAILRRPAVARAAPPPPPTPFSAREATLARDPGRPLDPATVAPPRPSPNGPSATPAVKLVSPQVVATPAGARVRTNTTPPGAGAAPPAPRPGPATPAVTTPKPPVRPDAANAPKPDGASPAASPPARVPPSSSNVSPQLPPQPETRVAPPRPPAPVSGAPTAPAPSPAELRREPRPAPAAPAPGSEARREAPPAPTANRPPPSELRREAAPAPPVRPAVVPPLPPQPVVRPSPPAAPVAPVAPQARQPDAKAEPAKNDAPRPKSDEPK